MENEKKGTPLDVSDRLEKESDRRGEIGKKERKKERKSLTKRRFNEEADSVRQVGWAS